MQGPIIECQSCRVVQIHRGVLQLRAIEMCCITFRVLVFFEVLLVTSEQPVSR